MYTAALQTNNISRPVNYKPLEPITTTCSASISISFRASDLHFFGCYRNGSLEESNYAGIVFG